MVLLCLDLQLIRLEGHLRTIRSVVREGVLQDDVGDARRLQA
jgi:hypothetical protein